MIDKEYLKKLKKEDYIAWDSLVNDPMITGVQTSDGCVLPIVAIIIFVIIIFSILN
jgi:hypothetical protein